MQNYCSKFKTFYFLILLLTFAFLFLDSKAALSQTMSNSDYILQMGNLNSGSGKPTGPSSKVSFTTGQTGANLFSGTNYKVRAGFQYINSIIYFRFSISNNFVNFGTISPTIPILRTNVLSVSNGSAYGYQVTASQNHNLRIVGSGQEIPQTACDSGFTCTATTANQWTNSLTYGLGYRCDNVTGTDCELQFATPDFYKPFDSSPSAQIVMSSANVGENRQATITYKLNVSGTQAAGTYTNVINYIATPSF